VIYVSNSTSRHPIDARALEKTARTLLKGVGEDGASLSVALVGDAAIRSLNRVHRGNDRTTDVLSFPLATAPEAPSAALRTDARIVRPPPERLLGDVVISLDRAAVQAAAYDATLTAEVRRLLIHGILHLLGHDHEAARDRARMVAEERRLAKLIGLPWPYGAG
jgi:probable rRNA maturation factor